jgi:hypothetical protein
MMLRNLVGGWLGVAFLCAAVAAICFDVALKPSGAPAQSRSVARTA